MYCDDLATPLGLLRVVSNGEAICAVKVAEKPAERCPDALVRRACRELQEYFTGARQRFDLPLDPAGTPFQKSVWRALTAVGWGSTTTYGALAAASGHPGAARAVGSAMRANPILILIPCHRVLARTSLGGFALGLERKRLLLTLEGHICE